MRKKESPAIDQEQLVAAWKRTLPTVLNASDKVSVFADEADPQAIRITILAEGRSGYEFDFICSYVDDREVKVQLVDAERDEVTVDERGERIQQMVEDYIRHIHECAQVLHAETHA